MAHIGRFVGGANRVILGGQQMLHTDIDDGFGLLIAEKLEREGNGKDPVGAQAVIVPKDRAVGLTPAARKVAAGAADHVPVIQVTNLARALKNLQGRRIRVIGLAEEAHTSLFDTHLCGSLALVMGAEERGLKRLTKESCDVLAHLPMAGSVNSLNVSVAVGIALFEAIRQQRTSG